MPTLQKRTVEKDELEKFLSTILTSMHPSLKNDPKLMTDVLKQTMSLVTGKFNQSGKQMTLGSLFDKDFMKKLLMSAAGIHEMNKPDGLSNRLKLILDPLLKNKEFMKELKKLMDPKNQSKNVADDLKKLMDKFFPGQENALKKELTSLFDKIIKKTSEQLKIKPPAPGATNKTDDLYVNLFGLLNSAITGAHPVPVAQYIGNGLGFNDWNPYDGNANIDSINSVNNYQFGDPQGFNADKIERYSQIPDTMVDTFVSALKYVGIENRTAPTLGIPGAL